MIRQRKIDEALKYAQEQLAERGEENKDVLSELERTLALLAFDKPEGSPFGDLLHLSHRQKVSIFVVNTKKSSAYSTLFFTFLKRY